MDQVDEAKNLGEAVADRRTAQGVTRYRPCPHPERHQTATFIPCQDCDVRANPGLNTEAKHELREQEPTPLPVVLRLVIWQNLWNWTQEESGTTRIHITSAAGLSGKTLCGRPFPATKGYPVAVRFCKRCVSAAQRSGIGKEAARTLAYVGGGHRKMTHREAMTSPYGEDWRGLRNGAEPPECEGELIDSNPGCFSSDIYWTVFTCSECFAVVFTVEGSRHWWNHEGDGSAERMRRITQMRTERAA